MFSAEYLTASREDLKEHFTLITPPVGYGKTYFANNELTEYFEKTTDEKINYTLLLVPTKAIKDQVLRSYHQTKIFCSYQLLFEDVEKGIYVACFQQLAQWINDGNPIPYPPKLILIDEVHQVAEWNNCFDGYLSIWEWLHSKRKEIYLCGLTATPDYLINYVNPAFKQLGLSGFDFLNITKELNPLYSANRIEVWQRTKLTTVLNTLEPSEQSKIFAYTESAKECEELASKYNAGFLVSIHNEDLTGDKKVRLNERMESQKVKAVPFGETTLREYLIENGEYPQEYNLVIANNAYNCGVNIHDTSVNTVAIYSNDLSIITQTAGRLRHNTERIIICFTCYRSEAQDMNQCRLVRALNNRDNQEVLKEAYLRQQEERFRDISTSKKTNVDIVICKWGGIYEVNPFALAYINRINDIEDALQTNPQGYFEKLKNLSGNIVFVDKEKQIAVSDAKNRSKINSFVPDKWINRKLFKQDKEQLALELDLRDNQRHLLKWNSVKKHLVKFGYQVEEKGSKAINPHTGKKQTYSIIKNPFFKRKTLY